MYVCLVCERTYLTLSSFLSGSLYKQRQYTPIPHATVVSVRGETYIHSYTHTHTFYASLHSICIVLQNTIQYYTHTIHSYNNTHIQYTHTTTHSYNTHAQQYTHNNTHNIQWYVFFRFYNHDSSELYRCLSDIFTEVCVRVCVCGVCAYCLCVRGVSSSLSPPLFLSLLPLLSLSLCFLDS